MCWDQQIDGTILSLSIKGCLTQQTLFEKLATVFNFLLYMRYGVQLSNKVIHIENKYTRDSTLRTITITATYPHHLIQPSHNNGIISWIIEALSLKLFCG